MKEIVSYLFVFSLGIFVCYVFDSWQIRRTRYSGTIQVSKDDEKTLYSLELDEDPHTIETKKALLFKVDVSQLNSVRE